MNTNPTTTFAIDLAERAAKTFIQGALGASALILVTVDGTSVVSASWWAQVGSAALVGGVASVASLVTNVGAGLKTGTASLSRTVASAAVSQPATLSELLGEQVSIVAETGPSPDAIAAAALAKSQVEAPISDPSPVEGQAAPQT